MQITAKAEPLGDDGDNPNLTVDDDDDDDDLNPYHPFFYLTDLPSDYVDELVKHTGLNAPWQEFTYELLKEDFEAEGIRHDQSPESGPSKVDDVYRYFKNCIRPAGDVVRETYYSYFTFVVVDSACVQSKPWECIVCSDAPDYGESNKEVKLKQMRLPICKAMQSLCALEQLNTTASDLQNPDSWSLCSIPAWTLMPVEPQPGDQNWRYRKATPLEAREGKRRGMELIREVRDGSGRTLDRERRSVIFWCPHEEARMAAEMNRAAVQEAVRNGFQLGFRKNRISE